MNGQCLICADAVLSLVTNMIETINTLKSYSNPAIKIPSSIHLDIDGKIIDITFPEYSGLDAITSYIHLCNELSIIHGTDQVIC